MKLVVIAQPRIGPIKLIKNLNLLFNKKDIDPRKW
jgi:hypothetical protein|tara:strand:- start:80 stop:184 length:105 start_codon:yes stop_codon:yes gene_type:complete